MKKSHIFIIAALTLACFWVIIIGVFAAKSVNNYREGKDPRYAHTQSQYLESHKMKFPVPAKELILTGDGDTWLNIRSGNLLTIETDPRMWKILFTDHKDGRSEIRFKKLNDYNDPVTVIIPAIPSVSVNNFTSIVLERLEQKEMKLSFTRVLYLVMDSCKVSDLNLSFPWTAEIQDIFIKKNNRVDSLEISVPGPGKIRLETTGWLLNRISLSDAVKVEATSEVIKELGKKMERR